MDYYRQNEDAIAYIRRLLFQQEFLSTIGSLANSWIGWFAQQIIHQIIRLTYSNINMFIETHFSNVQASTIHCLSMLTVFCPLVYSCLTYSNGICLKLTFELGNLLSFNQIAPLCAFVKYPGKTPYITLHLLIV